jgi:chaperonin cofactor prefoldin
MAEPVAQPSRDRGHEALRQDILATVADLEQNTGDTAIGLDLTDTLFDLIDGLYTQIDALNTRADAAEIREQTLQSDMDALQQRVAALEPPKAP